MTKILNDEYDYLIFDKQIDNDHREYIYSMYERRGIEYLKPSFFQLMIFSIVITIVMMSLNIKN